MFYIVMWLKAIEKAQRIVERGIFTKYFAFLKDTNLHKEIKIGI